MLRAPFMQWTVTALLLASIAGGRSALAQVTPAASNPGPPGTSSGEASAPGKALKEANLLFNEGVEAARAGQWEKARALMHASFEIRKTTEVAAKLAVLEMKTGRHRDAAEHLAYFLREGKSESASDRERAEAMLAEAKKHVATLVIEVEPTGAAITVDGRLAGKSPLPGPVFVEPGKRIVEARVDRGSAAQSSVEATAGKQVVVALRPAAGPLALVDVPATKPEPVGDTHKGAWPFYRRPAFIAGAATTAAALGAGIAFTVVSNNKSDGRKALLMPTSLSRSMCMRKPANENCGKLKELQADQNAFGNAALWSFIAAGVAAGGTTAYALLTRKRPAEHAIQAVPIVAPQGGALLLRGYF